MKTEPKISTVVVFGGEPLRKYTGAGYVDVGAREVQIFHGSGEKFLAMLEEQEAAIRSKAEAARAANAVKAKERSRTKGGLACEPVITREAAGKLEQCSDYSTLLKDVLPFEFTSEFLGVDALMFGDKMWRPTDRIFCGGRAPAWEELRLEIYKQGVVDPNPRGNDEPLKRKWFVIEFSLFEARRRLAYLLERCEADVSAVVLIDGKLQCWFCVEKSTARATRELAETAVFVGANLWPLKAVLPGMPLKSNPRETAARLQRLGVQCDKETPARAYCLYLRS